ncbi:TRAP transporter substrate-binding protein [Azospirillum sp. ST 5-10]|uniref:TRAP transporter substrate-binding protein n=1 Tax=unclassified Azospirillum TaxID=2630922 RepID=UPI003F4A0720
MKGIARALCAAAALAAAFTAAPAVAKEFKVGLIVPPTHAWTLAAKAMGEAIKTQSGGKHTVAVFPAGQLGSEAQMLQQLQTGALDMAFLTVAEISNHAPDFGALYAPYLVKDIDGAARILHGGTATGMLKQLPRAAGVVGIDYGIAAMRVLLTAFPADTVKDLEGKKLRITPFEPIKDFFSILKAAPTPMPLPDVYDALANGQVDGVDADVELVWKLKLQERGKMLLNSNHMMFPMVGVVSGRVWQSLSKEERALVETTMRRELAGLFDSYAALERDMLKKIGDSGLSVHTVGPEFFGDTLKEYEAIWLKKAPVLKELRAEAAKL